MIVSVSLAIYHIANTSQVRTALGSGAGVAPATTPSVGRFVGPGAQAPGLHFVGSTQ